MKPVLIILLHTVGIRQRCKMENVAKILQNEIFRKILCFQKIAGHVKFIL